jgi:DNA-directed RNA polymerase sigma subunit (sigma70/sigma32)
LKSCFPRASGRPRVSGWRARLIVALRFGFDGVTRTLEQIGRMVGVSDEVLREIQNTTLEGFAH